VIGGSVGLIAHIAHVRSFEGAQGWLVVEARGEGPEQGQVGRPLEEEDPPGLFRLVVVLEADLPEGLQDLAAAVVQPVRPAHERDDDVAAGSFVEQHFGMTGGDDLAAGLLGRLGQQLVYLALPQDLEVCIRFVQQQHGTRIPVHVCQKKQGLLQAACGGREIEVDPLFLIAHRDLAPLRDVSWRLQPCSKQAFNSAHQVNPAYPIPVYGVAEIPQGPRRCVLPRHAR